jgi:ABC-type taurine transport system substrate-binding protein
MLMLQANSIERELDERHAAARVAYSRRDIDAYREIFSPTLSYQQADGRVIDRHQLMRDVAVQFHRLCSASSSFTREHLSTVDDEITETLVQVATAEATAYGFVHRTWKVDRRAIYTWTKLRGSWTIAGVQVLSEKTKLGPG